MSHVSWWEITVVNPVIAFITSLPNKKKNTTKNPDHATAVLNFSNTYRHKWKQSVTFDCCPKNINICFHLCYLQCVCLCCERLQWTHVIRLMFSECASVWGICMKAEFSWRNCATGTHCMNSVLTLKGPQSQMNPDIATTQMEISRVSNFSC